MATDGRISNDVIKKKKLCLRNRSDSVFDVLQAVDSVRGFCFDGWPTPRPRDGEGIIIEGGGKATRDKDKFMAGKNLLNMSFLS